MADSPEPPNPPGILAQYVVEALQRQSVEKLNAIEDYVQELREHKREQEQLEKEELLEDPDVVEAQEHPDGDGYYVIKPQKCGADCECNDGDGHGPYKWHVTDNGKSWEVVGKVVDGKVVPTKDY